MIFIRNLTQLRSQPQGCVATIGNFDGVHLGHQVVLQQLAARAKSFNSPSTVVIFEPQPQEFFVPDKAPPRLTRLREKVQMLQQCNIDKLVCLQFNAQLAALTADAFVQQILVDGLGIHHLVIGDDFQFGQDRQGDFAMLQTAGKHHYFTVEKRNTFLLRGSRVSSTRIRQLLLKGDIKTASELLGRPYTLCGRVHHGQQLGRRLGFPTANIPLHRRIAPLNGVFAVKIHGIMEYPLTGVANLGYRPTVKDNQLLLEVHLFDFNQSIYGKFIEVEFVRKLRDEKQFSSFEGLQEQIAQDALLAKTALVKEGMTNHFFLSPLAR